MYWYQLVFFVTSNSRYVKTLDVRKARLPIFVYHIVDGAFVVFFKYRSVYDIFFYILFVSYFCHVHRATFCKYYYIINVATVIHILIFAQARTHKALSPIHIQFSIAHYHFGSFNTVKHSYFGFALTPLAVSLLKIFKMSNSIIYQMSQVVLHLLYIRFCF